MGLTRPVTAAALLASAEMQLRYPGEIELRRGGSNEGEGRGFDNLDLSAAGERTIAVAEGAGAVVAWFVAELSRLGWTEHGDGWLARGDREGFVIRVDLDRGVSRVAALITDPANRRIQEQAEATWYAGAPDASSVVSLSYTVAPELEPPHRQ
jgi:hypothetical protein